MIIIINACHDQLCLHLKPFGENAAHLQQHSYRLMLKLNTFAGQSILFLEIYRVYSRINHIRLWEHGTFKVHTWTFYLQKHLRKTSSDSETVSLHCCSASCSLQSEKQHCSLLWWRERAETWLYITLLLSVRAAQQSRVKRVVTTVRPVNLRMQAWLQMNRGLKSENVSVWQARVHPLLSCVRGREQARSIRKGTRQRFSGNVPLTHYPSQQLCLKKEMRGT